MLFRTTVKACQKREEGAGQNVSQLQLARSSMIDIFLTALSGLDILVLVYFLLRLCRCNMNRLFNIFTFPSTYESNFFCTVIQSKELQLSNGYDISPQLLVIPLSENLNSGFKKTHLTNYTTKPTDRLKTTKATLQSNPNPNSLLFTGTPLHIYIFIAVPLASSFPPTCSRLTL